MKGDFTRSTFKKEKHYRSVHMQQGRVQMDADWNEQIDITAHRVETETIDVVGECGAPRHHGGFHLVANVGDLEEKEKGREENQDSEALQSAGDFYISAGRYYLEGILCENEQIVPFSKQPDGPLGSLPKNLPDDLKEALKEFEPPEEEGIYLAYLDVWSRHITALEDPEIPEKALGGPDTATRTKTVWQVKLIYAGEVGAEVNCLSSIQAWEDLKKEVTGTLAARAEEAEKEDKPCILAPGAGYRRLENQLYRVEVHRTGELGSATFKWSRDNGSIVTEWTKPGVNKLTVASTGRDRVLNFANGQWVELTDDTRELLGEPGTLVKLDKVEGDVLTIDPNTATGPVDRENFSESAKVRRWDLRDEGEITPTNSEWIDLEDGVQVKFSAGTYRTGDYWLIPARTANADVEWPAVTDGSGKDVPESVSPHGINHHYCELAILEFDGSEWTKVSDCRQLFPPVTRLTSLFYVSGDGQEAMPGKELPEVLRVRVSNGQVPVTGAKVRFTVVDGGGTLSPDAPVSTVAPDGTAECNWTLGAAGDQQVKAELLDLAGQPVPGQILGFNANLSVATDVAYDPKKCAGLNQAKADTVQKAIDELCKRHTKGGCAITVGPGGQFETLELAFDELKDATDICLRLLPGTHTIEKNLEVKDKNSIKITGCAASIQQQAEQLQLGANRILLVDFNLKATADSGTVILSGNEVTVEDSTFKRTAKAAGPPLVVVVSPQRAVSNLRWKNNRMIAWWKKRSAKKPSDYLTPAATVFTSEAARKRFDALAEMSPHTDKEVFNEALDVVLKDVKNIKAESRKNWFVGRPGSEIDKLVKKQKTAVDDFYRVLSADKVDPKELRTSLTVAIAVFTDFGYTQALALSYGVGGWVEDNKIDGYLTLHYHPNFKSLTWSKATEIKLKNRKTFSGSDAEYITVDPVTLNLRGNALYAVDSNGYSITQVMKQIDGKGSWGSREMPETGYEFLTVTGNVFESNGNGFVSQSVVMAGNTFADKAAQELDIAAYVLGYSGIFVGNVCPTRSLNIETMLRPSLLRASANIVSIVA